MNFTNSRNLFLLEAPNFGRKLKLSDYFFVMSLKKIKPIDISSDRSSNFSTAKFYSLKTSAVQILNVTSVKNKDERNKTKITKISWILEESNSLEYH